MAERVESFTSGGVPIAVEWFRAASRAPAIVMLHGADGLTFAERYRTGARLTAAVGYHVVLPHYFDRTGDRWASLPTIYRNFGLWAGALRDTITWLAGRVGVEPERIGVMGISLGASLAMAVAAEDARIRALVDCFGPVPEGLAERATRMPPTLILHGAADPIVPVAHAYELERLLTSLGAPCELMVYPAQGHGFHGAAEADAGRRVAGFLERFLQAR